MTSPRSVIALTCYLEPATWGAWSVPAALIPEWYLELFHAAGAEVVLLPPGTTVDCLERFDGLAMAGALTSIQIATDKRHTRVLMHLESAETRLSLHVYEKARELNMPVLGYLVEAYK